MKKIILLFTLAIFLGQWAMSQNLLTNPGFEDWTVNGPSGPPDGWELSSSSITASQEAVSINSGTYSANLTWTTSSTVWLEQTVSVTAGESYEFTFWALDNIAEGRGRVAMRWYDAGDGFISGHYGEYTNDSPDWQQLSSGTQVAPVGAVTVHVEIRVYDVSPWPGSATIYVDDASLENVSGAPAVITNAFAVSNSAVDVVYDKPVTSADPGDYYITGTTYHSFASAVIDGSDPTIVHLTGVTPPMVGDLTLDEIFDDGNGTSLQFYAGILPIAYTNTNNPGGTMLDGFPATFQGIVSANDNFNNVWVSDNSGQYNGVLIYDSSFDNLVSVGDEIIFTGERVIFSTVTEISNASLISTLTTGNTPYGPDVISGSDIDETIGADTNPAEAWEGQLVKIENFTVESYVDFDYTCSWSNGFVTYYFHIGDNVDYQFGTISLTVGSTYQSVTGVVDWDYNNLYYRINPRNQLDIEGSSNPPIALEVISVNGGIDPYAGNDFEVVVQAQDNGGNPAAVTSDVNFTFTTDGGDLGNVEFVSGTTTTGTILMGSSEVVVTGVQMAPTGTNVSITANDDASQLISGTSLPFDVVELTVPDIIITEIMQNPADVGDGDGEYFEIYNNTASSVDLDGWVIKDNDFDSITISGPLVIQAYDFLVLGNTLDQLTNGGYICDYEYASLSLSNGADELVLALPDGLTEVDRVEWDGGAVWPDPTGASMTYTGFPEEDNNDGTKWVWATFREASFDDSYTDRGSPGSNGYDQILTGGFKLDLKVYLESYYVDPDSLSNYYGENDLMPFDPPFNPALPYYGNNNPEWLYNAGDTVTFVPFLASDWLLIELRDAASAAGATPATTIAQMPAMVLEDGSVVSMNGTTRLNINENFTNDMYIVVWNINHLGIMSANGLSPINGTVMSYDFTTGAGQVYGGSTGFKELATGIWGMASGDVNGDQVVDTDDKVAGWATEAGEPSGYQGSNLMIDDQINNQDKNEYWVPNVNMSSQVPQ